MTKRIFSKTPAGFGRISIRGSDLLTPTDIYEYARAFRSVYTRSMPLLKKFEDPDWARSDEIMQLYGKAQSLAVQIAMSNELLLKAILLGSTGKTHKGHNLKDLIYVLDQRYVDIIKHHLESNGLKDGRMDDVFEMSAEIFVVARYGFEGRSYELDFLTLQLVNEALDYIFNNYVPNWTNLTAEQQRSATLLKKETDLLFDVDYQKAQAKQWREMRKMLEG